MINLLLPEIKVKYQKSRIRGLWRNDAGRLFYDYLTEKSGDVFYLNDYKIRYNQESIFYTSGARAYCYYAPEKVECFLNKSEIKILKNYDNLNYNHKVLLKIYIKDYLKKYNGVTIIINKNDYTLISYYNE